MKRFLLSMILIPMMTVAVARSAPPELPSAIAEARPDLGLVGTGTLTWFVFRVYDAWLWAPGGRWSENRPFVLDLRYARDLIGAQIADRSVEEIRNQGLGTEEQLESWGRFMREAFPDVAEGDRLTGEFMPGAATRFYLNGEPHAVIEDPDFGPAFAAIWLAPATSEPRLRRQLLGEPASRRTR